MFSKPSVSTILMLCLLLKVIFYQSVIAQQTSEDKKGIQEAQKLLDDLATYGAFTSNFVDFSNSYAQKFQSAFGPYATIYNPFTEQNVSLGVFIEYVKQNFTSGLNMEFSYPENFSMIKSDEDYAEFIFESQQEIFGYSKGNRKIELVIPVLFNIRTNLLNGETLVLKLEKIERRSFGKIDVQLVNIADPKRTLKNLELQLLIHDSIFQRSVSNQNGLVTFIGVPYRDAFSLSFADAHNLRYKKPILYSYDTIKDNMLKYFLPVVKTPDNKHFITSHLSSSLLFGQFRASNLSDSLNYTKINGQGYENAFTFGYAHNLMQIKRSILSFEIGVQFSYASFSLNSNNLQHTFEWSFNSTEKDYLKLTIEDLDFRSSQVNMKAPVYIIFSQKLSNKLIGIIEFGGGINLRYQINSHYSQLASYNISSLNTDFNLDHTNRKNHFESFGKIGMGYGFFAGFKSFFPASSIMYGARLRYVTENDNQNERLSKSIFDNSLYSLYNPKSIVEIMQQKKTHSIGLEFIIAFPLDK